MKYLFFILTTFSLNAGAQVTYINTNTSSSGTTSATPSNMASGVVAGDILIMLVGIRYDATPTTPTGYTLLATQSGGLGANGVDAGGAKAMVFYKIADGTENGGTVTVSNASGNSIQAKIYQYRKTNTSYTFEINASGGADITAGTDWSITSAADVGLKAGDLVIAWNFINGNVLTFASPTITSTGVVFSAATNRFDNPTVQGSDSHARADEYSVTSGTSSTTQTWTLTGTGTPTASHPAGSGIVIRMRETAPATRRRVT